VILGHTTGNLETPMYRRLIFSFHMPLFFFLAGMSIKPKALKSFGEWKGFIWKNLRALVVPYLIFAFIYAPFSFDNVPKFLYGSWQALGKARTLTSLWYLTCFFIARIYCQILTDLVSRANPKNLNATLGLLAIPMFAVGFLLPKLDGGYLWCLDISFVASGFILLGIALRQRILIFAQAKSWVLALFTAAAAASPPARPESMARLFIFAVIESRPLLRLLRFLHRTGFGNSHKIMQFIFACLVCSVIEHDFLGGKVVFIDSQVDFFFRNDVFCDLKRKSQAFRSIAFATFIFTDAVADVTGAIPKSLGQVMTNPEFSDKVISVPEIVI
jgi:hypothetical protein